jgi:MFS family permease
MALTCGGLARVIAQTPAGALVDATHRKRLLLGAGITFLAAAALTLALKPVLPLVVLAQIVLGSVGAILGPTVTAITLGMVKAPDFDRRFGRNQTFNAAGNVAAALMMGGIGYAISNRAIFLAVPLLAIPCALAILAIDPRSIDYARSRGARNLEGNEQASGLRTVLSNAKLLAFASCAVLFHFANAAMLPQLGEMLAQGRVRVSAPFMSAGVIVTQLVIALTAARIGRMAAIWGENLCC